jgi:deferrochelatase/peroxidase EfeB
MEMGEHNWLNDPIPDNRLEELKPVLSNLQGHILHSHGRDRSVHIVLRFTASRDKVKQWIHRLARRVTSTQRQYEEAEAYRQYDIPGRLFVGFFLSAEGYEYLGIDLRGHLQEFIEGMKGAQERLADPGVEEWETGYQQPIHAMVLLADNDEGFLLRAARHLLGTVQGVAEICAIEYGRVIRHPHTRQTYEHFGYVDGRSQPLFFKKDVIKETDKRGGTEQWNPKAGPSLVLVEDPNGDPENQGIPAYGSYLVFRKLEQNVYGFQKHLDRLADDVLELQGHDRPRAEAMVMGRFCDGTPVVLQSTPGQYDPVPNNFNFEKDSSGGFGCPYQAHIRKMNPRGERDSLIKMTVNKALDQLLGAGEPEHNSILNDLAQALQRLGAGPDEYDSIRRQLVAALQRSVGVGRAERYRRIQSELVVSYDERRHRIARRSVPYGTRQPEPYDNPSLDQLPKEGVGLLFMCYQSDIRQQFEFLQANWANNQDFPVQGAGHDAITGRVSADEEAIEQKWPKQWNDRQRRRISYGFPSFVRLKGGEYFFAPSISFLKSIK